MTKQLTEEQKIKNREANKRWREANPDRVKHHSDKWRKENPDRAKEVGRNQYYKHRDRNLKKAKQDYYQRKAGDQLKFMFERTKHKAKARGYEWLITMDDLTIPDFCCYLNIPLDSRDRDHQPSIDRIDNGKGYVAGNVVVCSWRANRLKKEMTLDELEMIASALRRLIHK